MPCFSPTFHSTSTEMYPCVHCGRVLITQQSLNYHLAQKPKTCEKYLRKLSNQEKQAAMESSSSSKPSSQVAPATQTTVVSLSSAAKSTVLKRTPLAGPPLASPVVSKFVRNDVSVSTSSSPKRSSQVAKTITSLSSPASLSSQKGPGSRDMRRPERWAPQSQT